MSAGWSGSTSARARVGVARLDRVEHRADERRLQPVVLVELGGVIASGARRRRESVSLIVDLLADARLCGHGIAGALR